jgi:hypothetical protein
VKAGAAAPVAVGAGGHGLAGVVGGADQDPDLLARDGGVHVEAVHAGLHLEDEGVVAARPAVAAVAAVDHRRAVEVDAHGLLRADVEGELLARDVEVAPHAAHAGARVGFQVRTTHDSGVSVGLRVGLEGAWVGGGRRSSKASRWPSTSPTDHARTQPWAS